MIIIIIEKYPLKALILENICFVLIGLFVIKIGSTPLNIVFMTLYGLITKKIFANCRNKSRFQFIVSHIVILVFAIVIIYYIGFIGDLQTKEYINKFK